MLRTPFTGGAEARIGGTDRIEALLQEGKFWKYRAVSAGCASKLVARSVVFVSGALVPTLFDIENILKRYEGGLVHFDEQTPAYRLLGLLVDDRVTTASLFVRLLFLLETEAHKQFEFIWD